ncbi:unnamed protein product [Rhizoctonia solani]|uniref:Uncharacterized protein n=1 Tax=Rhizoctonia solani TaxID=456999 RepID=A0A8H3HGL7_9AGAM|nr:unnamed protein product [Rhizoctonia solani]
MSQPNKTLYIKNLNDQVRKDELKSQLYALFTPYGRIVDVVAIKSPKMRGQAFVVFQDLAGATAAMRAWDGELFYDKEMKIEYAKTRSHATRRIEEPGWDPLAEAKAKALGLGSRLKKDRRQEDGEAMDMDDEQSSNPHPQQTLSAPNTYSAVTISSRLLCTNIPPETQQEALEKLFQKHPGLQSLVLTPPGQPKSAQVQFEQPDQAKAARDALHGHSLKSDWAMSVTPSSDHDHDRAARVHPSGSAASMNTLGYISRQYDAIASTPTTPTSESIPLSSPFGQPRPSIIQDDSDILRLARQDSPTRRIKSQSVSPTRSPLPESAPDKAQRQRFILIRFIIGIWSGLCTLWSLLPVAWKRVRHNFGLITLSSDDDEEEEQQEEEEEEEDPLVARAPITVIHPQRTSFSSNVLTKRTNRSSYTKPPTPGVSEQVLDDIPQPSQEQNRPRAASTLLPNPLSTSLLTPSASALPSRAPTPPIRRQTALHKTKTLVLDLDETLIHSTSRPMHAHGSMGGGGLLGLSGLFGGKRQGGGHMVEVVLGGRSTLYHVYKRPFVDFFLRKVSSWYTLVIFTASMPEYADPVIDWLDAGRGMFSRRFFRDSCTHLPNGGYSKDLSIIDQDLSRVCLIDNSPASYSINSANGIPIEGWISDPGDEALLDLLPVLDSLRFTSDVRHVLGLRGF